MLYFPNWSACAESTFLNALLGKDLLKHGAKETTFVYDRGDALRCQ